MISSPLSRVGMADSQGQSERPLQTQRPLKGEVTMEFKFATDSETGVIVAASFAEACGKLDAMMTDAVLADGAWGWVEDADGTRYEIGC